ncbi:hypothetical protein RHMOL_Rhmol10G0304500 [Rhododendron molle]|uniref:Uncharacterized protein n=1 Tax=Rhododendron molle TaxID=49168 RepID=A0ACC0M7M4_RHOML|nr:hypothetical protein RHMOL_Rhmol10G0304500 [Rhododendron molle]
MLLNFWGIAVSGGEHVDVIIGAAVADGKVTPKVQSLIKILLKYQHTDDFRAIIFVERVVAALVLPKVTLLVATSVAEEGLDIRQCNVVIRLDLAKTVLAYIQSRGRARKPGSDYILMVERGNLSHEAFLRNARNSEETLRKEAIERTDLSHLKDTSRLISVDKIPGTVYQVESIGAVVSLNSAVGLVHFYCSQLPSDRYSILRPEFIMERHEMPGGPTEYSCRLQLPCNAPFENLEGPVCSSMRLAQQAVCLAACKKLHEMGAFTDMLLSDKGSGGEVEKVDQNDEGDPLPGTARHREFYPEGVANILQGEWILFGRDACNNSKLFHLYMYDISCMDVGSSKDPFLAQASEFAVLFGNELDAEAYLFVPMVGDKSVDPLKEIDWGLIKQITTTDAWSNPLQRARPDVYLGTNERTLGGDRREYGFGKLRHGMAFGQKSHPTYGIRGAVAQFDIVKASGLVPSRDLAEMESHLALANKKIMMADSCISVEDLEGRIVTAAHSGKRFYVDSVRYDMTAENSFPRKEGYLGPLEYSSYANYYKQKYYATPNLKRLDSFNAPRLLCLKEREADLNLRRDHLNYFQFQVTGGLFLGSDHEDESDEALDKTYYVFLPPELCFVHPLPASLVRGAQRLPSIMRRIESMLLAIQLKDIIDYPVPALKILEALTAASCQETFCCERAELLGDAYLKWVVSRFLFLKYPQKHEGQLTRMRQQMVSNMVLYQYALKKGLQSYIQADRFAPSRWAAPGVLPVFDEDIKETESSFFHNERALTETVPEEGNGDDGYEDNEMEDGELESDSSSYRVLSNSKTLADVVEALIGVYYVEGGKNAANHLMKWIGIQRLEFVGDAVLDHLITRHLFFTYTDLPPGRLTDLRAAAVNNENFARVAVKHKLHLHLRHGSSDLEKQVL